MRIRHGLILWTGWALWLILGASAREVFAQGSPLTQGVYLTGTLREIFTRDVKTSSNRSVIGLTLGESAGPVLIGDLKVVMAKSKTPSMGCFTATTSDGVYLAIGELRTVGQTSGPIAIKRLDQWKYARELREYRSDQFTAKFVSGIDCNGKSDDRATIYPVTFGDVSPRLNVDIASHGAAVDAELKWPGQSTEPPKVKCLRLQGRNAAFDARCTFFIDQKQIQAQDNIELVLSLQPKGAAPRKETYPIRFSP